MEQDIEWEWKGKYKSELLMVCHMGAIAMHEVGAITDKEMREYDRDCLVSPPKRTLKSKSKGKSTSHSPKPTAAYVASAAPSGPSKH